MLSERVKKLILALQDQYPEKRSALIPALFFLILPQMKYILLLLFMTCFMKSL